MLNTLGGCAFLNTKIRTFDLSVTNVTTIGGRAFCNTGVTTLKLPLSLETLGPNLFGHDDPVYTWYEGSEAQWKKYVTMGVGYTLDLEFGKETPLPPEPTVSSTTSYTSTPTDAVIKAVFTASESGRWTQSGVRLYSANGTLLKSKTEYHDYNMKQLSVWYDINSELGYTLSPNTTYTFEIYTYYNGKLQTASSTFKTKVQTTMTWTNTIEETTNTSFTFSLEGRANTTGHFSEYTFVLTDTSTGDDVINRTVTDDSHLNVDGAQWFKLVSWTPSTTLVGGRTYTYRASFVFNGEQFDSDLYSVTLPDTWKPHQVEVSVNRFGATRDGFDCNFYLQDNCIIQQADFYVYNDVDGEAEKVRIYPEIQDETNCFINNGEYNKNWEYDGKFHVNIDDVGGRRGCNYYVKIVAWDRNGNSNTNTNDVNSYSLFIPDAYPEATNATVTEVTSEQITLALEGQYVNWLWIEGFRIAAYPEGDSSTAYWQDFSGAKRINSTQNFSLTVAIPISEIVPSDTGAYTVDVYALDNYMQNPSPEPFSITFQLDREPPQFSDFSAWFDDDGMLHASCRVSDDSEIANPGFLFYRATTESQAATAATLSGDQMTLEGNYDWFMEGDPFLYVVPAAEDALGNANNNSLPTLVIRHPADTLWLPDGLKQIGQEAFAGISATFVEVPDGCATIDSLAFSGCANLGYIRIPRSVTSIASDAFSNSAVAIICSPSSAARLFAENNGIDWIAEYD